MLKILGLGNSFSWDATTYLDRIAGDLYVRNLHIGGCSLEGHVDKIRNKKAWYEFQAQGVKIGEKTVSANDIIASEDWDYITITSTPGQEGNPKFYEGCLDGLIAFLRANMTNPEAQIGYHMTWAFPDGSPSSAMRLHNNSRTQMFNDIVDTTQNHIMKKYDVDFLLASGTAVENARSSLGQVFTKEDGYHMNTYGEYVTGYMYFAALTGKPLNELKFKPNYISETSRTIIARAVNAALHDPFAETDLKSDPVFLD